MNTNISTTGNLKKIVALYFEQFYHPIGGGIEDKEL
jgi:hypothetical protein